MYKNVFEFLIYLDQLSMLQIFYKGIPKMMQLISNLLYKKPLLPFIQVHVQSLEILKHKDCKGNDSFIKLFG